MSLPMMNNHCKHIIKTTKQQQIKTIKTFKGEKHE